VGRNRSEIDRKVDEIAPADAGCRAVVTPLVLTQGESNGGNVLRETSEAAVDAGQGLERAILVETHQVVEGSKVW
jgi:hypothetical protein